MSKADQPRDDEDEEEDDEGRVEEAQELLQSIKDNLDANQGRLDDQVHIKGFWNFSGNLI